MVLGGPLGCFTGIVYETFSFTLATGGWVTAQNAKKLPTSGFIQRVIFRMSSGSTEKFSLYLVDGSLQTTLSAAPVDNYVFCKVLDVDLNAGSSSTEAAIDRTFDPWSRPYGVSAKGASSTPGETNLLVGGLGTNATNATYVVTVGVLGVS